MFVDSQSPPQLAVPVVKATGRAKVVFLNSMYIFFIVLRNAVSFLSDHLLFVLVSFFHFFIFLFLFVFLLAHLSRRIQGRS